MKMKRKGNETEVKMTMRWKLLNQDAKRGTQKKREGANTNTRNLAPNGQPWKGKGKEKRRPKDNGTRPTEEGEERSAWTNLTRRKPTTTSARNGSNLPGERRTQEHMKKEKKGQWGPSYWHDASTYTCRFPFLGLKGPDSSQPYRQLTCSTLELRAQFNLTNDHKRKKDHTCKDVLLPRMSCKWLRSVSWSNRKDVVAASSYAHLQLVEKKKRPGTAAHCFNTKRHRQVRIEKWPAVHFT